MEGALQHAGVTLTRWQQAIALREEKERVRILAEMEASSKMYAMLAKLPPVPSTMLPLQDLAMPGPAPANPMETPDCEPPCIG
jgi:hypothetical protein